MTLKEIIGTGVLLLGVFMGNAQGNIHQQGEGGVFTQARLDLLKTGEGGLGNNPSTMNLYSDMRTKFGRLGEEVNLTLDDIDGTIYTNENFELGTLLEDGVAFKRLYLRYDAYNDEIELKETMDADVVRSMVKHAMYSCSVNGVDYVFMGYTDDDGETQYGYITPLASAGDYVLYEKRIKVFKEGKPAKTSLDKSFPHRFLDRTEYYVSVKGGVPEYMNTKKNDVISTFLEKDRDLVKKYMKEKRVNVNDGKDLSSLFAYANTL